MKKIIKRVLLIFGILVLLLIAAAIILPIVYKDKIVGYAKTEANKMLNAKLDFDNDISLSLFKHFPDFSLGINHIRIINKEPFDGDTLVDIGSFNTTLDIMSVIKGDKIKIKTIALDKAYIHLQRLADGRSNWDIAIKSKDTLKKEGKDTTSNFKMALQQYSITNSRVVYDDKSLGFYMGLEGLDHSGSGDFTSDVYDLNTHTTADAMTVGYGGIDYLYRIKTKIDAMLNINMKDSKYAFKDNDINLNDLNLHVDGAIAMPGDDINMDIAFKSKQTEFKNILSLVPGIYQKSFKDLKSSGTMAFGGDVKGTYNSKTYPGFHINLQVGNGMFQYPGLPGAIEHVNVNTTIGSPGGSLDNTVVNVQSAHAEMGGEKLDAKLLVKTLMSDPYIDGSIVTKLTLDKIKNFIKLDDGTTLSGLVDANLQMTGNMSAVQKKQFDKFHAAGYVAMQNVAYASKSVAAPLNLSALRLDFDPKDVKLSNMALTYGRSDLKASGSLNNLLGYMLKNETLKGDLSIESKMLDVNQMMPKSDKKADTAKSQGSGGYSAVELPGNIDFTMKAAAGRILYDTYDISDFKGLITIKDKRLTLENINLKMLNAAIAIKGYYDSKDIKKPLTSMDLDIKQLSIPDAYKAFVTVQKFAPIAQYISGTLNGKINVTTSLGQDLMPDFKTLLSSGVLDIPRAVVGGYAPLSELADKLKMPNLKNLTLLGIHPSYEIVNGRFNLKEPVQFNVDQSKFSITGSSGLDKTLDYTMIVEMPAKQLQSQANSIINQAVKAKNLNLTMDQTIKANVLIKGTMDKPQISVSMKDLVAGTANAIKQQAQQELDKQKKALQEQAQKQIDAQKEKLKQEQQKLQDQATQKLNEEKKKQQDQINKQLEDQKKKLQDQGTNKLKDLFKK